MTWGHHKAIVQMMATRTYAAPELKVLCSSMQQRSCGLLGQNASTQVNLQSSQGACVCADAGGNASCKLTRSGLRGRLSSSYPCSQIIGTAWYLSYVIMMSYVRVRRMLSGSVADLMLPLGRAACGHVTADVTAAVPGETQFGWNIT